MKIMIISDSHDNLPNLEKAAAFAEKEGVKTLIHCGDIAAKETMRFIKRNFSGKICAVRGNADNEFEGLPETDRLEIEGIKIAVCHYPVKARRLAENGKYDFVFYGHTHRPWAEVLGKTVLANPGPLDNTYNNPTCALLETRNKKLELKNLNILAATG